MALPIWHSMKRSQPQNKATSKHHQTQTLVKDNNNIRHKFSRNYM